MSWFKSKPDPPTQPPRPEYLDRPNDPDAYTGEIRGILKLVPQVVAKRLAEEAASLSQLNLPIPTPRTELRIDPESARADNGSIILLSVHIYPPQFTIPTYLSVPVLNSLSYTIIGNQIFLTKAKNDLISHGLTYLDHYPGTWTNRDPYAFYKLCNKRGDRNDGGIFYYAFKGGKYPDDNVYDPGPLTPQSGLSVEAIRVLQHRTDFMSIIRYSRPSEPNISNAIEYQNPIYHKVHTDDDEYLFGSKLPYPIFPASRVSFKILPSSAVSYGITEQWLESLRNACKPICFELRNEPESLYYQLTIPKQDFVTVRERFEQYFPDFALLDQDSGMSRAPAQCFCITARPVFSYKFIKESRAFALDPYLSLFGLFDKGQHNEALQIFFAPFQDESLKTFIANNWSEEERYKGLKQKYPAWLMAVRFCTDDQRRIEHFKSFLSQYETAEQRWELSAIQELAGSDYTIPPWNSVVSSELASLVHFPGKEIQSERLETANMRTKLPPESYTVGPIVIGESEARGTKRPVTLPDSVRDRHVYIVGKSGMGKSTLITNAVIANMKAGEGVCVIDPHGDLVATGSQPLLDYVPEERIRDTIYFNAADKEYPLALNMLSAGKDEELSLLADNLLVMFRRQSDGWGPRMEDILRATLQTLMHTPGSSFLDIKRLLHNEAFRQSIVRRLNHPMLKEFWEEDFSTNYNRKEAVAPIISRVNKFLYLPQLYAMLSSPDSKLDFYDIIQSKKILLVNLSSGIIGEDNAQLLGSIIVSMLQMAAMRRGSLPPAQRHHFYLYVDEFQNFTTAAFEKILSEARKYKLCLTLAHQYISQLSETQRDAIFGNVGTMIMFSCGDRDASALRYQLGSYEAQDLVNLKNFEALCRPESAKDTFSFRTIPPPDKPEGFAEAIIEHTRMTYATIIDPDVQPEAQEQPVAEAAPSHPQARPAKALDKNFATKGDELLFYVEQAEYLNTTQIKQLCYGHLVETARAPAASRDLKKLIEAKRLKSEVAGGGNIYFSGRSPKPTSHNLEVRNLLVKIIRTGFEIAEVTFCPQLPSLVPDLAVSFLTEDGGLLKTFWEYDAGTEGIAELLKKVARYEFLKDEAAITFVFNSRSRLEQVNKSIKERFIRYAVLEEIGTLNDPVFQYASGGTATSFF